MSNPPIPAASCVVVSGGSRGLGLAIVQSILDHGAKVATFARTVTPELEALAAAHPDRVHVASVDATDAKAVTAFIKEAERKLGPVDGLVNNAAIGQDSLHVHTSPERIADIINTNLTAPLVLSRTVLRRILSGRGTGRVVFVTSICAQRGYAGLVAYSATKGGLDSAMRTIAREMHGRVLANSVAPGFFASEMSSVLGQTQLDTITRRTPTGRLVEPENVVPVIDMLLFEDTNINGQTLVIDGGGSI
ncbi:SDR family NAD(P)-dependent oxidoreductase [Tessaracoccus oleiagri]|uniref:3-oxoacyl-[acyl-carrier protein] reductase n=1 Tax=Tessaracoccus oleiagri TaxID=686624 RepID=A0A1G9HEX6_9ACTN|nr:SDR family NAD(P)-dependent oxidoreductase [Tessaracoccus oleiagri]SDL11396.1 3-oxoacyl-[acyl-carrier protein] reductase [Tessaracoccus oleiagri]